MIQRVELEWPLFYLWVKELAHLLFENCATFCIAMCQVLPACIPPYHCITAGLLATRPHGTQHGADVRREPKPVDLVVVEVVEATVQEDAVIVLYHLSH